MDDLLVFQQRVLDGEIELPPIDYGGPGSGNFGHAGRPGKVGGSASGGGKGGPSGKSTQPSDGGSVTSKEGRGKGEMKSTEVVLKEKKFRHSISAGYADNTNKFTHFYTRNVQDKVNVDCDKNGKVLGWKHHGLGFSESGKSASSLVKRLNSYTPRKVVR